MFNLFSINIGNTYLLQNIDGVTMALYWNLVKGTLQKRMQKWNVATRTFYKISMVWRWPYAEIKSKALHQKSWQKISRKIFERAIINFFSRFLFVFVFVSIELRMKEGKKARIVKYHLNQWFSTGVSQPVVLNRWFLNGGS